MSKETGGPAFPSIQWDEPKPEQSANWQYKGMTLWDRYFGEQAQLLTKAYYADQFSVAGPFPQAIARVAADIADAMIAERKKRFEASND